MKDVQKAAEEYAKGEYPIKTEEEYYKDDVTEPYYDYSSTAFIIQKRIQMAFLAGTQWKGEGVEALKKDEIPSIRTDPRNWTEDYGHENGNYICHCYNCQRTFFGHKRRVVCKECSDKYESELEKAKKEIERLKGLIESVKKDFLRLYHKPPAGFKLPEILEMEIEAGWQQFKIENNL